MRGKALILVALVLGLVVATPPTPAQPRSAFPDRSFQVRLGGFFPEGGGDLWDENEEVFTLDISDFDDFVFGLSYVHPVSNRLELGINIDFYDGGTRSHYRNVFAPGNLPIFNTKRSETLSTSAIPSCRSFPAASKTPGPRSRRSSRPASSCR
jgi:hypothetical protein